MGGDPEAAVEEVRSTGCSAFGVPGSCVGEVGGCPGFGVGGQLVVGVEGIGV